MTTDTQQTTPADDTLTLQDAMTDPSQKTDGPKPPTEPSNQPPADKADADKPVDKPEDKPTDAQDAPDDKQDVDTPKAPVPTEYEEYSDPEARAIVAVLKESNLSPEDAYAVFGKAAETGMIGDVDAAKLNEKLGATKAQLVLSAVSNYFGKVQAQIAGMKNAVFSVTGGEDNFQKVAAWAREKEGSDKDFAAKLEVYRGMLQQGPIQASLAAKELVAAYSADSSNSSLDIKMMSGDSAGKSNLEPISKVDYFNELEIATRRNDKAKIAELHARRKLAKSL